jgi:transcriptional regulator with PAS, ATPase and Fis domain
MGSKGEAKYTFEDIIGFSNILLDCKEKALKASKTSSPILVYGETGTGKELFVQAIHNASVRKNNTFIAQNCAAIPTSLLEAMLFGTVKGSFTGADDRKGLFEIADGGTLYLDEINSMPLELQGKILRILQEGSVRRVGSTMLKEIDVRVIASLNEVPEKLLEERRLRMDLYYRLNVVRIDIPALRFRKEDIPVLIIFFINKFNKKFKASIKGIDDEVMKKLILWNWDGNVRELEHVVEGIFNLKSEGYIGVNDLNQIGFNNSNHFISLKDKLDTIEREYIIEALIVSGHNVSKAAELLRTPRQTLQSKIKRLNIKVE